MPIYNYCGSVISPPNIRPANIYSYTVYVTYFCMTSQLYCYWSRKLSIYATSCVTQLHYQVAILLIRLLNYKIILLIFLNDFYSSYLWPIEVVLPSKHQIQITAELSKTGQAKTFNIVTKLSKSFPQMITEQFIATSFHSNSCVAR